MFDSLSLDMWPHIWTVVNCDIIWQIFCQNISQYVSSYVAPGVAQHIAYFYKIVKWHVWYFWGQLVYNSSGFMEPRPNMQQRNCQMCKKKHIWQVRLQVIGKMLDRQHRLATASQFPQPTCSCTFWVRRRTCLSHSRLTILKSDRLGSTHAAPRRDISVRPSFCWKYILQSYFVICWKYILLFVGNIFCYLLEIYFVICWKYILLLPSPPSLKACDIFAAQFLYGWL